MKKLFLILGSAALITFGGMTAFGEEAPKEQAPESYETTQGDYALKIAVEGEESGVYLDGELLYSMPETNNISEAFLSLDGQQVAIVYGDCSMLISKDVGVAFYNQGNLTAQYWVKKLCLPFMTDRIPEGTSWEEVEQRSYDPQLNQLTIVSKDHSKRIFDMKTGEILVEENPLTIGIYAGGVVLLAVLFGIFWFSKYNTLRQASLEMRRQDAQKSCMERKQNGEK